MPKCGQCGYDSPKRKDRYCVECRKVYNARRDKTKVKQARADKYYWDVTVPLLRARAESKCPMNRPRVGVYYPQSRAGYDTSGYEGMIYKQESWEGYQQRLDRAQD